MSPRRAGSGLPAPDWRTCSRTCPASPAPTSGHAPPGRRSSTSSARWPKPPTCGPMTSGSPTRPRSSAAAPANRQTLGLGGLGQLRLLHLALALVLGPAAAPGLHRPRVADRVCLTSANADEREVLLSILDIEPGLLAARPGQVLIVDKGYRNAQTEALLAAPRSAAAAPGLRQRAAPPRRWPAQVGPPADRVG